MEQEDVYNKFNKGIRKLIKYLIQIKPKNNETKIMYQFFKLMKTVNKKSPQRYFNRLVAEKHSEEILSGDFHYFLSDEFDDNDTQLSSIIKSFKTDFSSLSNSEKTMIWTHLLQILQLNSECIKYKMRKSLF